MNIIVEEICNPSRDVKTFVRNLVGENAEYLSMFVYDKESALYPYLVQREVTRAHLLLANVGKNSHDKADLFLATEKESNAILGFAIIAPQIDNQKRGAGIMGAVSKNQRNKGVFGLILAAVKTKYSENLTFSCKPNLVDFYKKYGFTPVGVYQAQIAMSLNSNQTGGIINSVDDEFVIRQPKVLQTYQELVSRHGKGVIEAARTKWEEDLAKGARRAEQFWKDLQDT